MTKGQTSHRDAPIRAYAIYATCRLCEKAETYYVTDGYHRWLAGLPAWQAFPYLPYPDTRFIHSGVCPECQTPERTPPR